MTDFTSPANLNQFHAKKQYWILSHPFADILFLHFPWVFVFIISWTMDPIFFYNMIKDLNFAHIPYPILFSLGFLTFAHRFITHWIIFSNSTIIQLAPTRFFLSFCLSFAVCYLVVWIGETAKQIVFYFVAVWNILHIIHQRVGILRIYGTKNRELDGKMFYFLICGSFITGIFIWKEKIFLQVNLMFHGLFPDTLIKTLNDLPFYYYFIFLFIFSIFFFPVLKSWVREELKEKIDFLSPRFIFLVSNFIIIVLIAIHPITGIIAIAVSHPIEYFAMIFWYKSNFNTKLNKDTILKAVTKSLLEIFILLGLLSLFTYKFYPTDKFAIYFLLIGIGCLHFYYDGIIWKRNNRPF